MDKNDIRDDISTIIYNKSDGEIVGFLEGTNQVPLEILINQHTERVDQSVTMEDADGAEIEVNVPLVVGGFGELHKQSELNGDLDRLFITRAESKDQAYGAKAFDYNIVWSDVDVNISGTDTTLKVSPKIEEKFNVVTDGDGNAVSQPKERDQVLETDTNYSYINTRMFLVSEEDWPNEDDYDLGKFVEFKKVDHANRSLIDAE